MSISCIEIQVNAQYVLGYPIEQFLKLTISIPSRSSMLVPQPLTIKYPRTYERLREYLRNMIKPMLERIESSTDSTIGHPVLREKGVSTSVRDLKCQIELFWNGEYPFCVVDIEKVTDPLAWWCDIRRHDGAKVLSVRNINYCNGNEDLVMHTRFLPLESFLSSSIPCQMNVQIQLSPGSTHQFVATR